MGEVVRKREITDTLVAIEAPHFLRRHRGARAGKHDGRQPEWPP
jgi:hypothetical protein